MCIRDSERRRAAPDVRQDVGARGRSSGRSGDPVSRRPRRPVRNLPERPTRRQLTIRFELQLEPVRSTSSTRQKTQVAERRSEAETASTAGEQRLPTTPKTSTNRPPGEERSEAS